MVIPGEGGDPRDLQEWHWVQADRSPVVADPRQQRDVFTGSRRGRDAHTISRCHSRRPARWSLELHRSLGQRTAPEKGQARFLAGDDGDIGLKGLGCMGDPVDANKLPVPSHSGSRDEKQVRVFDSLRHWKPIPTRGTGS